MTSEEAYITLTSLFQELRHHNSFAQLDNLIVREGLSNEVKAFYTKYPQFTFTITAQEVQELKAEKIFNDDHKLNLLNFQGTTLEKLLIATLWKNGDLNKMAHILDGVLSIEKDRSKHALIFKQFGKSLSDTSEPIVDQHVLRAFEIATLNGFSEIVVDTLRKKGVYKSTDQPILDRYKEWFTGILRQIPKVEHTKYKENLDKVLFIRGKSVKI